MKKMYFLLLFFFACVYLDNVNQPASVDPNQQLSITLTGTFDGTTFYSNQAWFAIMLPTGFIIDSIRYNTANGLNELITQITDTVGKWANYAFPPDPYMGWFGFETQSYNQSSGSTYEVTFYLQTTASVVPGNYLIDYRTGDRYYNTLQDDSILDQPIEVTTNGINENLTLGKELISVRPNPFKTSLNLRCKKNGWVNIFNGFGKLVRSLQINQSGYWDGLDKKGQKVTSGTYFIRGNNSQVNATLLN